MFEVLEGMELFGNELLNLSSLGELFFRFCLNFAFAFVIIRLIYYKATKDTEFLFSIFLVNVTVFFICILLGSVKVKMGFAFGLFAIFSILRYRTEAIPIKAMTFLFIAITIAVLNSLTSNKISFSELLFANAMIVILSYILEGVWLENQEQSKKIVYEVIENIKPENRAVLTQDLESRTGLTIKRLEINNIDFLRDIANITIYYDEPEIEA